MGGKFSGYPLTRWSEHRNMILEEPFYYIDSDGRKWNAPKGSCINGATIPRALWSALGSPYIGKYRRASIVHDVAVNEQCESEIPIDRKAADRMFYHACRCDNCSVYFATMLYIGVRMGSYMSKWSLLFTKSNLEVDHKDIRDTPELKYIQDKFWQIADDVSKQHSQKMEMNETDLDLVDHIIEKYLCQAGDLY